MNLSTTDSTRLQHIGQMHERPWLGESWQRCIEYGHSPSHSVSFDSVPNEALRRIEEANHALLKAAKPNMQLLAQTIASTRYFAILTDASGIVIHTDGAIDNRDRRATVISRIGVDLSERSVGTSAIGAALSEKKPVWLHRGEHFFNDTSVYSCAGAPLFATHGACMGMLDLTGVDTTARPELTHMVAESARRIENTMVQSLPHALMLRVSWLGVPINDTSAGLLAIDNDGCLLGFNHAAKQMLNLQHISTEVNEIFALPMSKFFDHARLGTVCADVPLWSGLRVQVEPLLPHQKTARFAIEPLALKEVTAKLIKQAIVQSKGNVAQAAHKLGISRATLYRKLAPNNK